MDYYSPFMGNCQYMGKIVRFLYNFERIVFMISFNRLWVTMKEQGISQYKLIKEYKISTGQLDRLRKNGNVNTYTLNQLCKILHCNLEDIAEYIEDDL